MNNIKKAKSLPQEAQYLREKKLDYNLVKIFTRDWEGTVQEKERLNELQRKLRDEFYIELIYILTHKIIRDVHEAKGLYENIVDHKASLAQKLKRNVGIEVAALDYMKNIRSVLEKPEIIERDKLINLAAKAVIDENTGMYDRTALFANLTADIERAKRYGRPLSLLFCDIDNFKRINDTIGHESGDLTLRMIAQSIRDSLRETDMAFRYGGEEFICLLPETDIKAAGIVGRRLRQRIAGMKKMKEFKKNHLKVTVSVGIAQFETGGIHDLPSFIKAADQAMYEAKRKGKNQVCRYGVDFKEKTQGKGKNVLRQRSAVFSGQVLSSGLSTGRAFIYRDILTRDLLSYIVKEEEVEEELKRIEQALNQVHRELHQTKEVVERNVNRKNADIFEAQKMMLKDKKLLMDLEKELNRELINAEQAVRNVFRRWANRLRASENELIQDKADDLDDLSRRIIRQLLGYDRNVLEALPPNSIIVAKRLLPSDTIHMNKKNVKGVLLEEGGYNSHSAILARGLGVPAICCPGISLQDIERKAVILLDGKKGKVVLNPSAKEKKDFDARVKKFEKQRSSTIQKTRDKAETKGGERILVLANASNEADFAEAVKNGCDGIGLFRTESLYLEHKTAPSSEYLLKQLRGILKKAPKRRIVMRLLDVGGDKQLPYVNIQEERNPFLGLRGIRLLLKYKKLLETQVEVILNLVNQFPVELLIPMITLPKEILEVRKVIKEVRDRTGMQKKIKVGAMIETPAAVVHIEPIAKASDFLSIGTNDLIQYTMAVGRENMSMTQYHDEGSATVLTLIEDVVRASRKYSIPCCVCGEIGGDEKYIEELLKVGIRELSVSPSRIPFVKEKIRDISL